MRHRVASTAFLAGIIFVTTGYANADPQSPPCMPDGSDLSDTTPFAATADQRKVMRESYSSPEVAGLTATISRYLAGSADSVSKKSFGSAHADDLLRYPYAILSDDRGIMGGSTLIVWFTKTSDAFWVWDYQLGDSATWQVRAFERASCDARQKAWIRSRYGALMREIHS